LRKSILKLKKVWEIPMCNTPTQLKHLHKMYRLTNPNYLNNDTNLNTITIFFLISKEVNVDALKKICGLIDLKQPSLSIASYNNQQYIV
jgi:hypothetical protein